MKIDVSGIRRRDPSALNALMLAVKRSARIGSNKAGADSIADDVAQEVFMLFLNNLIERFDEEYNVEPLLVETSRRVALSLLRKNREIFMEDTPELPEDRMGDINTHNGFDSSPVSFIDQQRAMQALRMKFPGIVVAERQKEKVDASTFVKKRAQTERELSPSCARLREIRVSLGLTQESFSSQLGIPNATLLSYEYMRTPNVPGDIMDRAEEIFIQERTVAKRNNALAERSMKEYVAEWAEMLSIDPQDFKTIADIIGVAKSTVHRWMEGEMRPRPRELNGYISTVKKTAKRIKAGKKALSEIY